MAFYQGPLARPGRDPENELRRLRHRFEAVSRRRERAMKFGRLYGGAKLAALAATGGLIFYFGLSILSPWPPLLTLGHVAALPSCDVARAVGLAPAYIGQPGYWSRHDEDRDGRACEP